MGSLSNRLSILEPQILAQAGMLEHSVYGIVDRVDKIDGKLAPNILRRWKGTIGNMTPSEEDPTILLIEKLEPLILKHKKHKGAWGGRGGTKSRMAQDCVVGDVNSCGSRVFVMRERMKALEQSIYAGIEKSIRDLNINGFNSLPSKWKIKHKTGGLLQFGGLQNVIDMKGASNFKIFLMEESAKTKQNTIDVLGPTLRDTPGAELWWLWNPESSQDPMSQEYIVPYQADYDKQGYYEDEYHLFIRVGYEDNPWFRWDESLQQELDKDTKKRDDGRMSRSRFNHIWGGMFNDDVENSIILTDWFDACVDAHLKKGFGTDVDGNIVGGKVVGFDPSDVGKDPAGYVERHGVIVTGVDEIEAENGNRKFDVAALRAKNFGCDSFGWDGDGLGAILRDQADKHFNNTNVNYFMYKGSTSPHSPNSEFSSENSNVKVESGRLVKDVFDNKKAQNITGLAERVYKTYEAVVHGVYHNPDDLISFNSKTIKPEMLQKLKAEACKTPLKPSTKIAFYSKSELRKGIMLPDGNKIKIPSPNLFDALGVSFDEDATIQAFEWADTSNYEPAGIV